MFSNFARLVFPFVLLSIRAFSQNAPTPKLDKLASDFIADIGKDDREKVFVQTDKWIYAAGEDIWLRAYCIGSVSHSVTRTNGRRSIGMEIS
jgi:hypothetical protein